MNKRLLCIWLPNWPIQRLQAMQPELARQALVLQGRDARRGSIVAAANLLAREQGVKTGMTLSEATAVAQFEVREHDPHEDLDTLVTLADAAQQFSPIVGLESLDKHAWPGRTLYQPESLLLDVTGLANLFGGEDKLLASVANWLYEKKYFGCLAIAGSIGTAWAVANYGLQESVPAATPGPRSRKNSPPARSALAQPQRNSGSNLKNSWSAQSSRFVCIAAGQDRQAIDDLPIEALRIDAATSQALRRLGVRCVGMLAQLPRSGLATRLGQHLLDRWDQAIGIVDEPIVTVHQESPWEVQKTLEYPTDDRHVLSEIVRQLSDELVHRLGQQDMGVLRLVCRLDLVEQPSLVMQIGLYRPTQAARHLELLLIGQLEQQLPLLHGAVLWRATLQAPLIAPIIVQQGELFDTPITEHRRNLAQLVDNLSNRLGRRQVLQVSIEQQSQPELACSLVPMTGRRPDGAGQSTRRKLTSRLARRRAEPSAEDPLRRPTQLFWPPKHMDVIAAPDGSPVQFSLNGKTHSVHCHWGPERLESGWWRGPSQRRDYFRVETNDGCWWWIFRDLANGKWYLQGAFD